MGPDGHTASLFPQGDWLESTDKCVLSFTDEFAVQERISLSFKQIEQSQHIWILLIGKDKKNIFDKISNEKTDYHDFPARKILDFSPTVYYLNSG